MNCDMTNNDRRLEECLRLPENNVCCECFAKKPRWASTNLGLFICMRCAGIHRSLGTHISKVRSTTMDKWDEDMINCCERIGNTRGSFLYEHGMPSHIRPAMFDDSATVERFIRDKYERKLYYHPQFEILIKHIFSTGNEKSESGGLLGSNIKDKTEVEPHSSSSVLSSSIPQLWGGVERCTSVATFSAKPDGFETKQKTKKKSDIDMDELFTTTTTTTTTATTAAQLLPTLLHNKNGITTTTTSNNNNNGNQHLSCTLQANQTTTSTSTGGGNVAEIKKEIMSLFNSNHNENSSHVYGAWQPQRPSSNCYRTQ